MKNIIHPANYRLVSVNRVAQLMRGLFLGAMIVSLAALGHAQSAGTGTITGRVINRATGQYLQNAIVTVTGTGQYAISEFGGIYTLAGVPAGDVKIDITYR
jgi:iron complex outermembrane receptor protein